MKNLEDIRSMKEISLFETIKFKDYSMIVLEKGANYITVFRKIIPCKNNLPEFLKSVYFIKDKTGFCKKSVNEEIIDISHEKYNFYFEMYNSELNN